MLNKKKWENITNNEKNNNNIANNKTISNNGKQIMKETWVGYEVCFEVAARREGLGA